MLNPATHSTAKFSDWQSGNYYYVIANKSTFGVGFYKVKTSNPKMYIPRYRAYAVRPSQSSAKAASPPAADRKQRNHTEGFLCRKAIFLPF